MPLTRVNGDFSQVSNIVTITTPEPPPVSNLQIFLGFQSGGTFLVAQDLLSVVESGVVDTSLGYINGYSVNNDSSVIGAYGAYGEGSSAGASRSEDFSDTWQGEGFPIYSNAPSRDSRVAFGGNGELYFLHAGTRNTGQTNGAYSLDFGNDAFTWSSTTFASDAPGGIAGIDAIPLAQGDLVNSLFCVYTNNGNVYAGDRNGLILYATGGPSQAFQQSNAIPYARFAGQGFDDNDVIVGMFCGRIVVTVNGSETWDMSTYVDAFCDTNLVGGAGFNNPVMFGLAYGGGAWVALGTVDGVPRIRRSTVAAETPWADVTVPTTSPPIERLLDIVYDSANSRFIALGRSDVTTELTTGGLVNFDAVPNSEFIGTSPRGVFTYTSTFVDITETEIEPFGTRNSGDLAGYTDLGIVSNSNDGGTLQVVLRVPTAELRADPQYDYFASVFIDGYMGSPASIFATDSFNYVQTSPEFYELVWTWIGMGEGSLSGAGFEALFDVVDPPITSTVSSFHILQSVDGGATFTAPLTQADPFATATEKGWLAIITTPDPSFNLLQEDGFLIQQEDDFNILLETAP